LKDAGDNSSAHEAAIASLLRTRTIRGAAKACGISEPTLYRLLREPEFKASYRAARRELVEHTLAQLQQDGADATAALREIVKNKQSPASVRVAAARVILEQGIKAVEMIDLQERIERLEETISAKGAQKR
jgi:DNA-binding MurR/RpiR family transcriptional regulator